MYLKDIIQQSGPLLLHIDSIGSSEPNRNGKPCKKVQFTIKSTGKTLTESVFETTFKYDLAGAKAGDNVEVCIKDNGFVGYKIIASTAEYSEPASQTPFQQVKNERAATQAINDKDEYFARKDVGMTLGMLVKIFMDETKDFDAALALAKKYRPVFNAAVDEAYNADKWGLVPSEAVSLPQEVASAFAIPNDFPIG